MAEALPCRLAQSPGNRQEGALTPNDVKSGDLPRRRFRGRMLSPGFTADSAVGRLPRAVLRPRCGSAGGPGAEAVLPQVTREVAAVPAGSDQGKGGTQQEAGKCLLVAGAQDAGRGSSESALDPTRGISKRSHHPLCTVEFRGSHRATLLGPCVPGLRPPCSTCSLSGSGFLLEVGNASSPGQGQ